MPLGFYRGENERLVSVTSLLDYLFGIADEIDKWTLKQAILAVQKASKTNKLTQDSAIQIGLEARSQKLDSARIRGTQVHQAIQNLHSNIPYELSKEDAPYYEAYFNFYKDHRIEPILEEYKVTNHQYGYAGRLDFYGKLDGQYVILDFKTSNSIRWTYGLQLAMYRKCLEDMGHQVDATYVVHIKPKKRGGTPRAELFEFKYPFEAVKWAIGLFHMKLAHDPYVKWYERTDEAAIAAEQEKTPTVKSGTESVQDSDFQGQSQDSQDTLSNSMETDSGQLVESLRSAYQRQEGISIPSPTAEALELVAGIQTIRSMTQPEPLLGGTEGHKVVIPLDNLDAGVTIRFSGAKPRIIPDPSTPPLERHTSVPRPLDEDSELDSRRIDRP